MGQNSHHGGPPPVAAAGCTKIAVYAAPNGDIARVPLPEGVTPAGLLSFRGRARLLVDVIAADDPRTDDQVVYDAMRRADAELEALIADGLALTDAVAPRAAA